MDRRGFLIATGTTLGAVAADWSGALGGIAEAAAVDGEALAAVAEGRARRLTMSMVAGLERRLESLRRLEDIMGGDQLCKAARAEFELLDHLANKASYDEATGRRLFSAVAEAARITGWVHFDHGLHAAAQKYYITGLRASATAGDAVGGAYILAQMAHQTYTVGNPQDAVNLKQTALNQTRGRATPLVRADLHAGTARAYAKTPYGRYACARELEKARTAVAAGPHDDDPPWIYWITPAEIETRAAAAALDLGDPRRALDFFAAARTADYTDTYTKNDAIHLVSIADAYLALGEIDAACETAREAYLKGKEVDSARQSGALADFRTRLKTGHRDSRAAKEFLELTAQA